MHRWKTEREKEKKDTVAEALRSFAALFPGGGYSGKEKIAAVTKFLDESTRANLTDREIKVLLQPNSETGKLFSAAGLDSSNVKDYTFPTADGDSDDDDYDAGAGAGVSAGAGAGAARK